MKYIKNYSNFINESINYGVLYHIVDYKKLNYILDNNIISSLNFSKISLTRNKMMNGYLGDSPLSFFKLEIDANKLSHNYTIKPFRYKSNNGEYFEEWEEQVQTREIKHAFKYINKIIICKNKLNRLLSVNYRDEGEISDWFSNDNRINIQTILKTIKEKTLSHGFELYVQEGSIIKKDDKYIDDIINHPIHHINYLYASVLRGMIKFVPEGEKYGRYKDVLIDENENKIEDFYIGQTFNKNNINFELVSNKNELKPLINKEFGEKEFVAYIIKFRKMKDGNLYLEDIRPFN